MYFPAALSTCNSSAVLPKLCIGLFHNRQEKPWLSINFHYSISTIWHKISKAGNQLRVCSLQLLVYVKNICSTRKSFGKMWNLTIITSSSIITQKRKNSNHVSESTRKNSTNSGTCACSGNTLIARPTISSWPFKFKAFLASSRRANCNQATHPISPYKKTINVTLQIPMH